MRKKIIIMGGGGHAKVIISMIKTLDLQYKIVGIIGLAHELGTKVSDVIVIGSDDQLPELFKTGINYACIGIGSVGNNDNRKMCYEKLIGIGFKVPSLIHKQALTCSKVEEFKGIQIMAGAIVQIDSLIGENSIINTGSIIEHDCLIGSHVHVCPGAVICGGCVINNGVFIGAGAIVKQSVKIGSNALIGAGSVVVNDIPDNAIVKGVPAR